MCGCPCFASTQWYAEHSVTYLQCTQMHCRRVAAAAAAAAGGAAKAPAAPKGGQ
jgi:hypothetical protein